MVRLLNATAACKLSDKWHEDRRTKNADKTLMQEEKRKERWINNLPNLIREDWLPKIRSAAKAGRYSWVFQVLDDEEADAACEFLQKLGFSAHNIYAGGRSLKDKDLLSSVEIEW